MRKHPSAVEEQLLKAIEQRGAIRSLLRLTDDLCISYRHAYDCLAYLEQSGSLQVTRKPGKPLEIHKHFEVSNDSDNQKHPETGTRKQGDAS